MDVFKLLQRLARDLRPARDPEKLMLALAFLRELDQPHWPHSTPPLGAAWGALRDLPDEDLPGALSRATQLAARFDPDRLDGAFDDLEWHAAGAYGLRRAIDGLDRIFGRADWPEPADRLGVVRFVDYGRGAHSFRGEFYTPYCVARTNALIMQSAPGEWLLEPAVGGGALLLAAIEACRQQHGLHAAEGLTMVGIELSHLSALVCRMNLVLTGAQRQSVVFTGNALTQTVCAWDGDTLRAVAFSAALANPPFGMTVKRSELEPGEPLIIPERLHNRAYLMPADARSRTGVPRAA